MIAIINLFAKIFRTGFFVIKSVLKAHFSFANSSAWSEGHEE